MTFFQPFEGALAAAIVLAAIELITGTFIFLSFSIGCLAVAAAELFTSSLSVGLDVIIFGIAATLAIIIFRALFSSNGDSKRAESDVNDY